MLQTLLDRYCKLLSLLLVGCMAIMVVMVFGNVVLRYAFNSGIAVSEELSRWLFLWMVFLGAIIGVREHAHMGTDLLVEKLPPGVKRVVLIVAQLLMLWATWLVFWGGWAQAKINWEVLSPVTESSMAWVYMTGVVFAVSAMVMLVSDLWYIVQGKLTPTQVALAQKAQERAEAEAAHAAADRAAAQAQR